MDRDRGCDLRWLAACVELCGSAKDWPDVGCDYSKPLKKTTPVFRCPQ